MQSKLRYEQNIAAESKHNTKIFYKYINSKKQIRSEIGPLKDSDVKLATDPKSMESILNTRSHSSSVFNDTSAEGNVASHDIVNYDNVASPENTLENFGITSEEVLNALNDPKVLNETKYEIANNLVSIFNKSLQQGLALADWKTANVTPMFKKGDRKLPENYRPISLTSVVGKVLESIIRNQIVNFIECHSLIRDTQHGF